MKKPLLLLVLLFFFSGGIVEAHPGRTDASGGHTCRTNCDSWGLKYGEYHYHGGSAPVQSAPVVQQNLVQQSTVVPTRIPTRIPTASLVNSVRLVSVSGLD